MEEAASLASVRFRPLEDLLVAAEKEEQARADFWIGQQVGEARG